MERQLGFYLRKEAPRKVKFTMDNNTTIYEFITSPWIVILIVAELVMKGIALWKCGRNNQPIWYLVILIINSAGILPLMYLLAFQKKQI